MPDVTGWGLICDVVHPTAGRCSLPAGHAGNHQSGGVRCEECDPKGEQCALPTGHLGNHLTAADASPIAASPKPRKTPDPAARQAIGCLSVVAVLAVLWLIFGYSSNGLGGRLPTGSRATVVYYLTGSATGASITYVDGSGNIQQQTGLAVPLTTTSGASGMSLSVAHGTFVSFSAQNSGASGDLTCSIEADGQVINTGHSSGGYAIVSCSARVP